MNSSRIRIASSTGVRSVHHNEDDVLRRARGYPYPRPKSSFLFQGGKVFHQDAEELLQIVEREALVPVLAVGSNASPEQLQRKFGSTMDVSIPVIRCGLDDFDVGYAPLIASYGSIPATLFPCEGTTLRASITFLNDRLLDIMHSTEGAYDLVQLQEVNLVMEGGTKTDRILAYVHQLGSLRLHYGSFSSDACASEIGPVALSEIDAEGRQMPSLDQVQMQNVVKSVLCAEGLVDTNCSLDDFMRENATNDEMRMKRVAALSSRAEPFRHERSRILMSIGDLHSRNVD